MGSSPSVRFLTTDRVDGAFVFHADLKEMSATGGASQGRCLPGLRVVRKRYRGPGTQRAQEGTWVGFSQ